MRLIDIDALSHEMYHLAFETDSNMQKWDGGCWIRYKMFEKCRDKAPTIDAVPVVRCEDCKYYTKPSALVNYALGICSRWEDMTYPDGYCSYAERK